jgi:hypothetical protein
MTSTHSFTEDNVPEQMLDLDESLRCDICRQIYENAVMISERTCGHCFCSKCVRKTFRFQLNSVKSTKSEASCPTCRCVVKRGESALIPNFAMQKCVLQYKKFRSNYIASNSGAALEKGEKTTTLNNTASNQPASRSASAVAVAVNGPKNDTIDEPQQQQVARRAKMTYKGLQKKRLQQLCAADNLPTTGSEEDLRMRHGNFVELLNSEVDSIAPHSYQQVHQTFIEEDKAKRREEQIEQMNGITNHSKYMGKIKEAREKLGENDGIGKNVKLSSGNMAFDKKMRGGFDHLVAKLNEREKQQESRSEAPKNTGSNAVGDNSNSVEANLEATETDQTESCSAEFDKKLAAAAPSVKKSPPPPSDEFDEKPAADSNTDIQPASPMDLHEKFIAVNQDENNAASANDEDPTPPSQSSKKSSKASKRAAPKASLSLSKVNGTLKKKNALPDSNTFPKRPRNHRSIAGPWACEICTFLNTMRAFANASCEICGHSRSVTAPSVR